MEGRACRARRARCRRRGPRRRTEQPIAESRRNFPPSCFGHRYQSVYQMKVIDVPQARIGLYARPNSKNLSLRGYILAKSGRTNEADEVLRTLESVAPEHYVPPCCIRARVRRAWPTRFGLPVARRRPIRCGTFTLSSWLAGDPKWDDLREDPRFRALVERCDFMRTASHIKR